ncbi:MAG: hypothetical protein FJY98_01290 [Candidatus Liptonbacteria bacterium]|nr:hypothetical protein [Candidatus Liptonbacteria bacterium]
MNENSQQFGQFLHDRLREKGWNLEKLSQTSNISIAHLEHLMAGNFEALPPAPYVHGYLHKLGNVLDFDGEAWWNELKSEGAVKTSGSTDALPKNRFKESPATPYWIGGIALILIVYLVARFAAIFGTPLLLVEYPPREITPSETPEIVVHGSLRYGDKVLVNQEETPVGKDGEWEKRVVLHEGLNTIEIEGRRFLGGTSKVVRQILYTAPSTATSTLE